MTTTTTDFGLDPINNVVQASSIPFCVGGMHSTHGLLGDGSNGMIMYMDGTYVRTPQTMYPILVCGGCVRTCLSTTNANTHTHIHANTIWIGFHLSLKGGQSCLNLFVPSWTLDTRGKFVGAMVGILFLAILTEGISKLRFLAQITLSSSSHCCHRHRRWIMTLLHGLQAFVGYLLMLATMTFSIELFLCVLVGLGSGYAIFYNENDRHVTTNPCCNFIQDEADERILGKIQERTMQENENKSEECSTTEVNFGFPTSGEN